MHVLIADVRCFVLLCCACVGVDDVCRGLVLPLLLLLEELRRNSAEQAVDALRCLRKWFGAFQQLLLWWRRRGARGKCAYGTRNAATSHSAEGPWRASS